MSKEKEELVEKKEKKYRLYSNEIVFRGHPDKCCDQISAAILKECVKQDRNTRAGIETVGGKGKIFVTGELTTKARINVKKIVKQVLKDVGYRTNYKIIDNIGKQSPDINQGVDREDGEIGAGDQGQCIKEGTLIATSRGYIPIEEVVIGDKVLTSDGEYNKVYNTQLTGKLQTIKLTTNFGRELYCTPEHKIFADGDWVEAVNTLGMKINKDCTDVFGNSTVEYKITQENTSPHGGKVVGLGRELRLTKDVAYVMGILIGDGSMTRSNDIRLTVKIPEKKEAFLDGLLKVFTEEEIVCYEDGFTIRGRGYRKFLELCGFGYWNAVDKQVPSSIFTADKEIQCAFLRGLFDSDGGATRFKHHNRLETSLNYSSISKKLVDQVALLLRNLGILCVEKNIGIANSKKIKGKHDVYVVRIKKFSSLKKFSEDIGFSVSYKNQKVIDAVRGREPLYEIEKPEIISKIEDAEEYNVYDLSVENMSEFYANGMLVHNCFSYACDDTPEMLPVAQVILQKFARLYDELRKQNPETFYPDGKAQITGVYDENMKLQRIKTFLVSYQNSEQNRAQSDEILRTAATSIAREYGIEIDEFLINPTGKFLIGGFDGDAGLTGRKIVVDAFQSFANVGGGCVDRDTEYLTPSGWKKMCDYSDGDLVGQYNNGKLEFVKPISFINTDAEPMFRITSGYTTDMVLSENHNVLLLNKSNKEYKRRFIEIFEDWNNKKIGSGLRCAKVPMSFRYDFDNNSCGLSEKELRLMIAFCADGTWYSKPWDGTIHIKKESKKARLRDILRDSGIEYKEIEWNNGSEKGYSSFRIKKLPIKTKRLKDLFAKGISKKDAEIFAEEIFNWDGNCKNLYYSTFKEDADIVQFILSAVTGKQVRMYNDGRTYKRSEGPLWYVSLTTTTNPNLFRNNRTDTDIVEFIPEDGKMYCINVPSHNLILRRSNKIFVTGNCMNGKDPSKVDFSAPHKARQLAKRILKKEGLRWAQVQLSYAIGVAEPVSIYIDSDRGNIPVPKSWYKECTPKRMINDLHLLDVDYVELAKFGHFTD